MKRMHLHLNVEGSRFDSSIRFYRALFDAEPTIHREGYAKFMLDDPGLNFVIEVLEVEGDVPGIHHIGIQVEEEGDLAAILSSLKAAEAPPLEIGRTQCCFADSEKNWTADPQGIRWETFRSFGQIDEYGSKTEEELRLYNERIQAE